MDPPEKCLLVVGLPGGGFKSGKLVEPSVERPNVP
jgi:hypothetical protein